RRIPNQILPGALDPRIFLHVPRTPGIAASSGADDGPGAALWTLILEAMIPWLQRRGSLAARPGQSLWSGRVACGNRPPFPAVRDSAGAGLAFARPPLVEAPREDNLPLDSLAHPSYGTVDTRLKLRHACRGGPPA